MMQCPALAAGRLVIWEESGLVRCSGGRTSGHQGGVGAAGEEA